MKQKPARKPLKKSARKRVMAETKRQRLASRLDESMGKRDLPAYIDLLGPGLERSLDALAQSRKKKIDLLDLGAGYGVALGQMKKRLLKLGRVVKADAVSLAAPASYAEYRAKVGARHGILPFPDKEYHLPAELFKPEKEYDLIVSVMGALTYSRHPLLLVKGMMQALKPGGEIHLLDVMPEELGEKVKRLAKRQGLEVEEEDYANHIQRFRFRKKSR